MHSYLEPVFAMLNSLQWAKLPSMLRVNILCKFAATQIHRSWCAASSCRSFFLSLADSFFFFF